MSLRDSASSFSSCPRCLRGRSQRRKVFGRQRVNRHRGFRRDWLDGGGWRHERGWLSDPGRSSSPWQRLEVSLFLLWPRVKRLEPVDGHPVLRGVTSLQQVAVAAPGFDSIRSLLRRCQRRLVPVLADLDKLGFLECFGSLTVFVLVMDGRRVFVAVPGSFQLLIEVHPIELLCLLAGEVGGKCDLTSKC